MCEYEMDPATIVEDTEWTRFGLQMDGQMDEMDRQTDKQSETRIPPSTSLAGGITMACHVYGKLPGLPVTQYTDTYMHNQA